MRNRELALGYLATVEQALKTLSIDQIDDVAGVLERARAERRRVYIVGNGGSASTASHFACDLSKGALRPDAPAMRVSAVADNLPLLTAWANDTHFSEVFSAQLQSLVEPGDVVIAISTSGESENVLRAVESARAAGAVTVGFVGRGGGRLLPMVDHGLVVSCESTAVIEDIHMILSHLLAHGLMNGQHDSWKGNARHHAEAAAELHARERNGAS